MNTSPVSQQRGNAITETIVTLLALAPFLVGIPLLGKQLDVKHKSYDAARYIAWERTIWRSAGATHRKTRDEISLEARDRTLGNASSGVIPLAALRTRGIGQNALWRDREDRSLLDYRDGTPVSVSDDERATPVDVGYWFVPGIARGEGPIGTVAEVVRARDLGLERDSFSHTALSMAVRPVLSQVAQRQSSLGLRAPAQEDEDQLLHRANAAILSDTWSARDENTMQRRVDYVTTNELIEELEQPGRAIGLQALGKGQPLYGEGQYGWDPDLRTRSTALPAAYITRR